MTRVNGQEDPGAAGATVAQLLQARDMRTDRVAVEVNGDIVPRARFAEHVLAAGDRVEIVHFMGGG